MKVVNIPVAGKDMELDVCCSCQEIWFDPKELAALPVYMPPPAEELPPEAREALAIHQVERIARESEAEKAEDALPNNVWEFLAAVCGFPVKSESVADGRSYVTWGAVLLCVAVFILTGCGSAGDIQAWGFIPAEPLRRGGLTILTSMLLVELDGLNRRGLVVKGDCGIGKTLGVRILAARFKWAVVSAVDYAAAFVERGQGAFDDLADGLDFFGDAPEVLVIDDLGAEPPTVRRYGDERNVLAYVLERRYRIGFQRDGSRTVVTTNLTDAEIVRRYGARISDRLNEMADFVCVSGPSLRK